MESEEETSRHLPELQNRNDFPNREPKSDTEYSSFWSDLLSSNFYDADPQTFKAYAKVVEEAPRKGFIENHNQLERYLYTCVARADIEIKDLFERYAGTDSRVFYNLIPILIWVLNSQRSKRFVEPLLVNYYESIRRQWNDLLEHVPFGKTFHKFAHQPITLEEKDDLVLFYFMIYWKTIDQVSNASIQVYSKLIIELLLGVRDPPNNLDSNLVESYEDYQNLYARTQSSNNMQARVSDKILKTILCTFASLDASCNPQIKEALNSVLIYSTQEVLPEITLLTQYLISRIS